MKTNPCAAAPLPSAAVGFKPEFLDFRRGIHVGNLEENERITRILKLALEGRFGQGFVTERWGRGVFWQWIAFLPRANREAKTLSSRVSFSCAKYFISIEAEEKLFKCGLQVERGYVKAPRSSPECQLRSDWDWHRLMKGLRAGTLLERELRRLILHEDFSLCAGSWETGRAGYHKDNFPSVTKLRRLLNAAPDDHWSGFQVFYPMTEEEVHSATGVELVESMLAIFDEVTPLMNLTMQIRLAAAHQDA